MEGIQAVVEIGVSKMLKQDYGLFFKLIQRIARFILPKYRFERPPNQDEPIVFVAHHQNMIGPISILVWLKYYVRTWVLSKFTDQKAAYQHYVDFTFTKRYGWPTILAKMIAFPASYLVQWLTNSGRMIPVYRQSRKIIQTMKISQEALLEGDHILIFPDVDYSSNSTETSDIYEGFLHLEKKYFKETGKHLTFVPILSDKENKCVRVGRRIHFKGDRGFIEERKTIANSIREELKQLAVEAETVYKSKMEIK